MVNTTKLKAKMVERNATIASMAEALGINQATVYRKLNGSGDKFTVGEVCGMIRCLGLTSPEEITSIFFADIVA